MREKLRQGWLFTQRNFEEHQTEATGLAPQEAEAWQAISVPHDYMILNVQTFHKSTEAWYRRTLTICDLTKDYALYFEGVYMEAAVYVNDRLVGESHNGYISFEVNITAALVEGDNRLQVHVVNQQPNSRRYSGAGIYRDVWLLTRNRAHIVSDSLYVVPVFAVQGSGVTLQVSNEVSHIDEDFSQRVRLLDQAGVCRAETHIQNSCVAGLTLEEYTAWDIENPYLYTFEVELSAQGQVQDTVCKPYGIRKIEFSPNEGFFLNGRRVELRGVCLHHDLGGLGAKYYRAEARRRIQAMLDMGANAIRATHNPYAPDFLDLCDEMGILLVDEFIDMWRIPKIEYDFARFFDRDVQQNVASWIRRDRLHPCVIMWSLGNEIPDTRLSSEGAETTKFLLEEVRKHDPAHHAEVTLGENYMSQENSQLCASVLGIPGYNYAERLYDEHHAQHPDWILYGSETASVVQSRGVYHFPYENAILTDEDQQCSALGNSTVAWGASDVPYVLRSASRHPYTMGQFIWTGIDYIGEPTPYQTKNSYFGHVDTAGFPKDSYYLFQAAWVPRAKQVVLHMYPHWNWNPGQSVDVLVATNAAAVELWQNGVSLGPRVLSPDRGEVLAHWKTVFVPGRIVAKAYDEDGNLLAETEEGSVGHAVRLRMSCNQERLANGDLGYIQIYVEDEAGNAVPTTNRYVQLTVDGPGRLLCMDNGDSTDFAQYATNVRRLFNGKLSAQVEAVGEGTIRITASGQGMEADVLDVRAKASAANETLPAVGIIDSMEDYPWPISAILLNTEAAKTIYPGAATFLVTASADPTDSQEDLIWRICDESGENADFTSFRVLNGGRGIEVSVSGNGKFTVRCSARNGKPITDFYSSLDFVAEGFGVDTDSAALNSDASKGQDALAVIPWKNFSKIYGDSFSEEGEILRHIGNNVVLQVGELELGDKGVCGISITGQAHQVDNSIRLVFEQAGQQSTELLEFPVQAVNKNKDTIGEGLRKEYFSFAPRYGRWKVSLIFLPGSNFDLKNIQFESGGME